MTKLKPCPFCGGEAKIYGKREGLPWVACKSCIGQTACCDTKEEAIEAWNRRMKEDERKSGR